MIELNVYKNTDSTSAQYGKAYARVDYKELFDISKLAKHMSEHERHSRRVASAAF